MNALSLSVSIQSFAALNAADPPRLLGRGTVKAVEYQSILFSPIGASEPPMLIVSGGKLPLVAKASWAGKSTLYVVFVFTWNALYFAAVLDAMPPRMYRGHPNHAPSPELAVWGPFRTADEAVEVVRLIERSEE